jgi:adenosylmethionine-8-amino-7-oxononanoate aminotransferase
MGDVIAMCPPLVITESQVDALADTIRDSLREAERALGRA